MSKTTNLKTPEREYGTTRTNCKASLRVKLVNEGVWAVSVFIENHNHELLHSPSKIRNMRS
jgi:FAR1 DNA-binding domain